MTTELLAAPIVTIGTFAESWLNEATAVRPERPILWSPHGWRRSGATVRNLEHLSVLVSWLAEPENGRGRMG